MDSKETIVDRLRKIYGDVEATLPDDESAATGTYGMLGDPECPICHGIGFVTKDAPVGDPEFGRIHVCGCRIQQVLDDRQQALVQSSNLTGYSQMTFDRFNIEGRGELRPGQVDSLRYAKQVAMNFVRERSGWLLYYGEFGVGKTHLAAAIANALVADHVECIFQPVPDLLDWIRATYSSPSESYQERFNRIRNVPVLILDDLGTESKTPWADEKLFQILNHRYVNRLPTVITTNRSLNKLDGRIGSRFSDPGIVQSVKIDVPDYRRPFQAATETNLLSQLYMMSNRTFETFSMRTDEGLNETARNELSAALSAAEQFSYNPKGWLVFSGGHGVGKTHLAAAIGNRLRSEQDEEVLFIGVPELLDHLRSTFNPTSDISYDALFESVLNVPILILDFLNTSTAKSWALDKLFQIVNYRSLAPLPTVITTAVPIKDIDAAIRSRMIDRKYAKVLMMFNVPMYGQGADGSESLPPRRRAR